MSDRNHGPVPPLTIPELQAKQARYSAACRHRDRRLGGVLLAAVIAWVIAVPGVLFLPALRPLWLGIGALAGLGFAGDAVYVLATSSRFHRLHAPRCPACDRSLTRLQYAGRMLDDLARLEGHSDWPAELRERVREAAALRCPYCNAVVAAPAV
jgi:hypothetical protein